MPNAAVAARASTLIASLCACLAAALAGCHGNGESPLRPDAGAGSDTGVAPADNGADTGVADPARTVGPTGGQVSDPSGVSVTVPADAVGAPTALGIAIGGQPAGMPVLPATVKPATDVVALTPHGQTFAVPVTIHLPVDPALAAQAGGRPLQLYTASPGGGWTLVDGAHPVTGAVEASVSHFSFFVVGFETPGQSFPEMGGRKLDLLFMVDNSQSMVPLQQKLLANFPVLMQVLRTQPGGLPDLHVGVVSSSMGAGPTADIAQCPPGGDGGKLQSTPRIAGCSGPRDAYIAASANEQVKNYDGTLEDAFSCIAALGQGGCGFEAQLESVAVALGARGAVPENAGFLRADAELAIVLITNEDDCSAPGDTMIFDTTSRFVADPYGPLQSYRCNEYGHLCGGVKPPRVGTLGTVVDLTDCHSAEDGVLNRVSEYVQFFKGLKADPGQVFVSAITGFPTPYDVTWVQPLVTGDPQPWPQVEHSCTTTAGEYADPAVRLAHLVSGFPGTGLLANICDTTFAPALTEIASFLGQRLGPRCLQQALVAGSAGALALPPGCGVFESLPGAGGTRTEQAIPACGGGAEPCYSIAANTTCAGGAEIDITRADTAPDGAVLVVRCN